MKKIMLLTVLVVLLAAIMPSATGNAEEEKYLLRHTTQDIEIGYVMEESGTLNLFADNLPLPGSSIDIRNIEMRTLSEMWVEYGGYNKDSDTLNLTLRFKPGEMWMGYDFFKLPDLDEFFSALFSELDIPISKEELKELKNMDQANSIQLQITPQGELMGFEMELPPDAAMQGKMAMSMIENYLTMMIDPDFPLEPIAEGDSWTQTVHLDQIPFIQIPPLEVKNQLVEVVKTSCGKTFGRITIDIDWHFDAIQIQEELAGELFEYYEDKEFEVTSLMPSMDIKMQGEIWMDIANGYYLSFQNNSEFVLAVEAGLMKTSGHNKGEVWKPRMEYSIYSQQESHATSACSGECDEEK